MSRLRVAPIVEGHGEVEAARVLIQRIWTELLGGEFVDVLRPYRSHKSRLVRNVDGALTNAAQSSILRLNNYGPSADPTLVLVLLDADDDLPCIVGPSVAAVLGGVAGSASACVVANKEFETWFVAAAESLSKYLELPHDFAPITSPESAGLGKAWIERHFNGVKYSETIDQPKLTAAMDLTLCRNRSASFDKLCRELERFRS